MKEKILYEIKGLYRDDFRVTGYSFGSGEKSLCIVGSMRGNENQQLYCCAGLISRLRRMEEEGKLIPGKEILVVPCINPYSMNLKKRFWGIDNTDINRMFPGFSEGETTQRIADGVFRVLKGYRFGVQFASFYMRGNFVPHVRMMRTGYESVELAKKFGMPYVVLHEPRPFDTATLNYNWQVWETDAFSIYSTDTQNVNSESAKQAEEAVLNFMDSQGICRYHGNRGYISRVIGSSDFIPIRANFGGFFECLVRPGQSVSKGCELAKILHPYTLDVREILHAPADGTVSFVLEEPTTHQNTAVISLIRDLE